MNGRRGALPGRSREGYRGIALLAGCQCNRVYQVTAATLVLALRSEPTAQQRQLVERLRSKGVNVVCRVCDVGDKESTAALVSEIRRRHGRCH